MRGLLFFDIDGTLTNEQTGEINQDSLKAVEEARANGHLCFINTGRSKAVIPPEFLDFGDGYVAALGLDIVYHGEEIFYVQPDNELMKEVVRKAMKYNCDIAFEGHDCSYFPENSRFEFLSSMYERYIASNYTSATYPNDNFNVDKFIMVYDELSDVASFNSWCEDKFEIIDRSGFFEYTRKGYSKASGIDFLCQYFKIALENCYAFGDSANDLAMLSHVPHSVMMGNGADILRDKVEYITTNSDVDGIRRALEHYGLIEVRNGKTN